MNIFTIDFETYYGKTYSLSKMSTEAYISDDQFQIIMVGVKKNDDPTEILSFTTHDEYRQALEARGVHRGAVLCHNTMFDALILVTVLKITPPMLFDTLCMAQATLKPFHQSISLAKCLEHESSPLSKGTYVGNMLGRRLESLTPAEFQKYAAYCSVDCDGEWWLFNRLKDRLPKDEYRIIDMTLRMYTHPSFDLDINVLKNVLQNARDKKAALLAALPPSINQAQLSSNHKFAKVLEALGVDVPMKISPTTLKPAYAFAKTDPEFKDMEEEYEDDPLVGPILAARLGTKSTLTETRTTRFIEIAEQYGKLRVPLRYYGAHTGRYSGMQGINCQNLTRINPKNPSRDQLRYALAAPKGHVVLASDLAQIEARLNAWLCNCIPLLEVFRNQGDPYCVFASKAFNRVVTKADEKERFIGKTCILGLGYGMGWKKLQGTLRKDGYKANMQECKDYVYKYRGEYHQIPAMWEYCDGVIESMASGEAMQMIGPLFATKNRLTLPNGMAIWYHNLRYIDTVKYRGWSFTYAGRPKTLWGGKMVENIIQSLARITITEHMIRIKKEMGLRPALQAHDELVYVVPENRVEEYERGVLEIMKSPPSFAPDLPINAEAAWGLTYGDAK